MSPPPARPTTPGVPPLAIGTAAVAIAVAGAAWWLSTTEPSLPADTIRREVPTTSDPLPAKPEPEAEEPAPAWPLLKDLESAMHEAYLAREDGAVDVLRAHLAVAVERARAVAAQPPPALPGADPDWVRRRQRDLAALAEEAPAKTAPDAEVIAYADRMVGLLMVLMSAAEPGHIHFTGGTLPWMEVIPRLPDPNIVEGS